MSDTKIEQPLIWNLPVSAGLGSETGLRDENQDRAAAFSSPFGMVYIVADGMGGHRGGAEAARITVEGFQRCLLSVPASAPFPDAVSFAASETHKELVALGNSGDPNLSGMGSTVVLALIRQAGEGFELVAAHMGDSRLYLHRAGQLTLLTRDHTQVQWLVDANEIDEEMARSHPDASVLTRALGHGGNAVMDITEPIPLGDSDGILLCSDGLSGFVESAEIDQTIKRFPDATECVRELIQLALDRGSNDNVTVQFIRVGNQPEAVLPASARKTLPEAPVLAAAPMYSPHPGRPGSRRPMFVGLAVGLVLVIAGGAIAFRDKLFPAHTGDPAAISMERNIGDLRADASAMIAEAKRGENRVDKLLSTSIGAPGGRTNPERREKLLQLKARFHDLYRTAGEDVLQATTFENKLSERRNRPAGRNRDSADATLEAAIGKRRQGLDTKKKNLDVAMAGLEKLAPAAASAARP